MNRPSSTIKRLALLIFFYSVWIHPIYNPRMVSAGAWTAEIKTTIDCTGVPLAISNMEELSKCKMWHSIGSWWYEGIAQHYVAPLGDRSTRPLYAPDTLSRRRIGYVEIGTPCTDQPVRPVWAQSEYHRTVIERDGQQIHGFAYCGKAF